VIGYNDLMDVMEVLSFDNNLNQIGTTSRIIKDPHLQLVYEGIGKAGGSLDGQLYPVAEKGFLFYNTAGEKINYRVEFINNQLRTLWTDEEPENTDFDVSYRAFEDSKAVGSIVERKIQRRNVYVEELLVNDAKTGRRLFKVPALMDSLTILISDVHHDSTSSRFSVFGEYYRSVDRGRGVGFATVVYDSSGNVVDQKKITWEEITRRVPIDKRGRFESNKARILFHQTVRTSDGRIFVIGEQYRAHVNGDAIVAKAALMLVSPLASMALPSSQIDLFDFVVFEFDAGLALRNVHIIDKKDRSTMFPNSLLNASPLRIARIARSKGLFDYRFTQMRNDDKDFWIVYIDYDGTWDNKSMAFLAGSIEYQGDKGFSTNKFAITRTSRNFDAIVGKEDHVMAIEYFKRDRKVECRLQKVNK
jgi:hypothetical protein